MAYTLWPHYDWIATQMENFINQIQIKCWLQTLNLKLKNLWIVVDTNI
jgi:hypothetical protein